MVGAGIIAAPRQTRGVEDGRRRAMKAHTTWLSEAEKSRIVDEAVELLGRVGMRFAGSKVLPLLAERGADVDEATGIVALAPRARGVGGRPVPPERRDGRPHGGGRRRCWTRASRFHFAPSGCVAKTLDFRSGERRASTLQDVRECTALHRRAAGARRHVDAGERVRRARSSSASSPSTSRCSPRRASTSPSSTARPRSTRSLRLCEALAGDLERFRARPRISTVGHRRVAAPGGRRHPRRARGAGPHGVPIEVYSMTDRRGHVAGHAGRDRGAGPGRVPRRRHGPAGRGAGRAARLLLRLGRARHAPDHVRAGLASRARSWRPWPPRSATTSACPRSAPASPPTPGTSRPAGRLREGDEGRHRVRGRHGHRHRLGAGGLAQHDVAAAVGHRQRDGRHAPAAQRAGRGLRRHAGRRRRSPPPGRAAASSAARTRPSASAPASTTCRRLSSRLSYEKWVEQGTTSTTTPARAWRRCSPRTRSKTPYIDGAQLDELAAICRVRTTTPCGRARREADRGGHMTLRIGYIGLGALGRHLAGSLLRAGFPLTVYDVDASCAVELGQAGAVCADVDRGDRTRLRHHHHLPAVARGGRLRGRRGAAASSRRLAPGGTWIDMSTNDAHELQRLSSAGRRQGHRDARGAGHRRRAPRRRRHDHRARRRQAGGLREAPRGVRRHGRARLLHRRARPGRR